MFRLRHAWMAVILLASSTSALAESSPGTKGNAASSSPAKPQADLYGRDTPRGTISGLLSAMAERDYKRAGYYFESGSNAEQLSRELQSVLDAGGTIEPFAGLSKDPQGNLEDGLDANREQVGRLSSQASTPILLTRSKNAANNPVWRIARETSIAARQMHQHKNEAGNDSSLQIGGASPEDWSILLGIAAFVFLGFYLATAGIILLIGRVIRDQDKSRVFRLAQAAMPPLSLLGATLVFQIWAGALPVSIIARQILLRYLGVFAWVALAWAFARMIDAVAKLAIGRMEGLQRRQAASVISLMRRGTKLLLLFVATVAILDTFGINVTTGVAALGIGGIALALGAQKTVENLVGSVTLIADKPVQVGDFCKVGDVLGTVEDIGIRSTRIRTLDRTIVTIPNGDFSTRQIENFAQRDIFLFNPLIRLEHGLTSARLLATVEMIEAVLSSHDRIVRPGFRARVKDLNISSIDVEIFSYIEAKDFDESLVIRQDILLTILSSLEVSGVAIAYPTQTLLLRPKEHPTARA